MRTHTVVSGDRLYKISGKYYGDSSKYMKIVNANPVLLERIQRGDVVPSDGSPTIYPGDVLYIPDDEIQEIKQVAKAVTVEAENNDDLTVFINGESVPTPPTFNLEIFFDTAADRYQGTFPYNYLDTKQIEQFKPYKLQEVQVFIGNEQLLTGNQESVSFSAQPDSVTVASSGRSKTYIIVKSNIPTSAYPLERNNMTITQVLQDWLLPVFGLGLEINTDVGASFERVTASESQKTWPFVSGLAVQRGVVISNTPQGKVLLTKPVQESISSIEFGKTSGIENLTTTYDSSQRFGNYTGLAQSPGNGQLNSNIQDSTFEELSYKVFNPSDTTAGNIKNAVEWESAKAIRDALEITIPQPSWINPQTKTIYKAGDYINLKAPQVAINSGFTFLVRSVLYKKEPERKTCELRLIPPQAYSGELITNPPWN
jgi:prophage tail gpP-like protein